MTLRVGACLSLSGRYARFGAQAGQALRIWQAMVDSVELIIEDDQSNAHTLEQALPRIASRCDVLLGPYSTHLARAAGDIAADQDLLLWNHGGAGDDVQAGHPGHVVSVPTPASRYPEPFLRHLASDHKRALLWIVHGSGRFGQQVAAGAARLASQLGIDWVRIGAAADLPATRTESWDLFTAGSFDDDIRTVNHAQALPFPPRTVCAVAAGVSEFRHAVASPDGVFGISQWIPGHDHAPELGPAETDFLSGYTHLVGTAPDYPAVQAVAAAALATRCAHLAGTTRQALWPAAASLNTRTLFGPFHINPVTGTQIGHDTLLVRWGNTGELRTG